MGGFDQVVLQAGSDLMALEHFDLKLWAALSCPTTGLEFDQKTLDFIDTDSDGRIRAVEVIAAVKWAGTVLKNPDDLLKEETELPLSAIDEATEVGRRLLASARQILVSLGKQEASSITAEEISDAAKAFFDTKFNGDGVITTESADGAATGTVIEDIIRCMGSVEDRSGKPGIDQDLLDRFFVEAEEYSQWWVRAESDLENILPLGEATLSAAASLEAVRDKVEDYFTRSQIAAYDRAAVPVLNPIYSEYEDLAQKMLSWKAEEIASFPLARIEANRPLPLVEKVNPAWADAIADFRTRVVEPILGDKVTLDMEEWKKLTGVFVGYQLWQQEKVGRAVEGLGLDRVRQILDGVYRITITTLIKKDRALEAEADEIISVERLARYYRHLYTLLRNFVSFDDFYKSGSKAIFQVGTLYLDGRSCDLCIAVEDIAKHSSLASLARTYVAYCACSRNGGSEKMQIAAAFTDGDADNLTVGRNGVFYDRKGRDWDATIVSIIENPISIRQAFWAPYRRFARMISEQIEKVAASREKQVESKALTGVTDIAQKAKDAKGVGRQSFDIAKFAGVFAAFGLAIGAIGTAIASVVTGFLELKLWKMPLALAGLLLVVSGPSMIIAYLKLRMRNFAPMLDANGWAINARALINIPFGNTLTGVAKLPKSSRRSTQQDPFAEKRRPLKILIGVLIFIALMFLWEEGHLKMLWDFIVYGF